MSEIDGARLIDDGVDRLDAACRELFLASLVDLRLVLIGLAAAQLGLHLLLLVGAELAEVVVQRLLVSGIVSIWFWSTNPIGDGSGVLTGGTGSPTPPSRSITSCVMS